MARPFAPGSGCVCARVRVAICHVFPLITLADVLPVSCTGLGGRLEGGGEKVAEISSCVTPTKTCWEVAPPDLSFLKATAHLAVEWRGNYTG